MARDIYSAAVEDALEAMGNSEAARRDEMAYTDGTVVARPHRDPTVDDGGVYYQRCGGGRRVVRKAIGGH